MGCCMIKRESNEKINYEVQMDHEKHSIFNHESIVSQHGTGPITMEFARGFFKHKMTASTEDQNLNTNHSEDDYSQGIVTKKNSEPLPKNLEQEEFSEKKNKEEEQKEGVSCNIKDKEILCYPKLEISVVYSRSNLQNTDKIVITPNSINGILKKKGEKFSFGRSVGQNVSNSLLGSLTSFGGKMNDYNFADESIGQKQFDILFNKEKGKFYILDNKRGTGLFVKVKQKIVVNHDMIVSFCASHMILQIEPEIYHPENKIIKLRFLQGPYQNQEKVFNSKDKKIIRIGRSKQAEVVYKDDSVSRIQCTIVFENGDWNLHDGYLDNGNKGSTNGIWLLASNKLEMCDDMVLKTGNTTLLVKLKENENNLVKEE